MKKNEIEVPNGKKAKWVNGVLTLVDEKPKDVTERIKTFDDACEELGYDHPFVCQYKLFNKFRNNWKPNHDILAYLKLRIITAALNEGWEPKFTGNEWRYYPWFYLYTQKEIDEMSEEDKSRVVGRASSSADAYGGLVCSSAGNVSSGSHTYCGSRLAFKTHELAEYAGRQFAEIYADFNFKSE